MVAKLISSKELNKESSLFNQFYAHRKCCRYVSWSEPVRIGSWRPGGLLDENQAGSSRSWAVLGWAVILLGSLFGHYRKNWLI